MHNCRFTLGVGFRVQYGNLLKGFSKLPVFRTCSIDRLVDSAYVPGTTSTEDISNLMM